MFIGFESFDAIPQQRWLNVFTAVCPFALQSNDIITQPLGARAGLGIALLPRILEDANHGLVHMKTNPKPPIRKHLGCPLHTVMAHLVEVCTAAFTPRAI